jgi:hypothetical protein
VNRTGDGVAKDVDIASLLVLSQTLHAELRKTTTTPSEWPATWSIFCIYQKYYIR